MAWFAAAIPYISTIASTGAAVAQGVNARNLANYNARLERNQGKVAQDQAVREEEGLRRGSRLFMGRQAAAIAQAGIGSGGTAGLLADQTGVLSELDALTLRYQGKLQGTGLVARANASAFQGKQDAGQAGLLAGGQLLMGAGRAYPGIKNWLDSRPIEPVKIRARRV